MLVVNLKAAVNPVGGQIDLSWTNPVWPGLKSIKVLRREAAFPEGVSDQKAIIIYENLTPVPGGNEGFSDTGLKGETVYYYSVIACDPVPNYFPAFIAAAASDSYNSAAYLYGLLPALYRNYDESGTGILKRLFAMLGPQIDLLRSRASGMRNLSDTDSIEGALLDMLAKWIGWNPDLNIGLAKQRNEIKYAPHYYRTTGIAANVRSTINRLATWDARVKEFVHNVFLSNNPERLTLRERERHGNEWKAGDFVNLDVMFEGRPFAVMGADGRKWIFYHAVSGADCSGAGLDLWCKTFDFGEWLPAKRISLDGEINKYPAVMERQDGSMHLFWSCFEGNTERKSPRIKSCLLSGGRQAYPARIQSTLSGPFALVDGDRFSLSVYGGTDRTVTFREEHFNDINNVSAEEIAELLDREIPGVVADLSKDRKIRITSNLAGAGSGLKITEGAVKLGFTTDTVYGINATRAEITGDLKEPFLLNGKSLVIRIDRERETEIIFNDEQTAAQVVETVNKVINIGSDENGYLRLSSPSGGGESFISLDLDASSAAAELGFRAPLPQSTTPADDAEPSVFKDGDGTVWLFWSSRRAGMWKIWYNSFDGKTWGSARQLTTGMLSDRRPEAVFNSNAGRLWVLWSRKKENGLWNIFYRSTAKPLVFDQEIDWDLPETEITPLPADYDNDGPSALAKDSGEIELFYSSNRTDGWNIWSKTLDAAAQGPDSQITTGQFTQKAPVVLKTGDLDIRLFTCTNESREYMSKLYPLSITSDFRYTGSTATDFHNTAKNSFRKDFEDIQHYTYDTLKGDSNWYARDTLGIFLQPDTVNEQFAFLKASRILKVLKQFLPVQVRPVIIMKPPVCRDHVYTYDFPESDPQVLIGETGKDSMSSVMGDIYAGPEAESEDTVPEWVWLHSWSTQFEDQITVDFNKTPVDTRYRTWHTGLKRGG